MRLRPKYADSHPGFVRMALGLFLLHLVFCLDNWLANASVVQRGVFLAQAQFAPRLYFAVAHAWISGVGFYGLYRNFRLARLAFLLSVTIFTLQGVIWTIAAHSGSASYVGGFLVLFVALVAAVMYTEPRTLNSDVVASILTDFREP